MMKLCGANAVPVICLDAIIIFDVGSSTTKRNIRKNGHERRVKDVEQWRHSSDLKRTRDRVIVSCLRMQRRFFLSSKRNMRCKT